MPVLGACGWVAVVCDRHSTLLVLYTACLHPCHSGNCVRARNVCGYRGGCNYACPSRFAAPRHCDPTLLYGNSLPVLVQTQPLRPAVKVFFEDTLKFFLSLYGHRLPVLSMSISDDDDLIVTASADKNVKIWGRSRASFVNCAGTFCS